MTVFPLGVFVLQYIPNCQDPGLFLSPFCNVNGNLEEVQLINE